MKITKRQIEDTFVGEIDGHFADRTNPHEVTADQVGSYSKDEVDSKESALINMAYYKGYWYGRREPSTPWPLPAAGETWPPNSMKAFDFADNTPWMWNGAQWTSGNPIPVVNGTTIGVSTSFLDITDAGYPGKAIYSAETESWDFYPDKYNEEIIQRAVILPGKFSYSAISDAAVLSRWRMIPADGRTISVADSRVERLLQYCLIPHATATANSNIMGLYLTNDNFVNHSALASSGKTRATPAENGAYFAIPDACGLFLRGSGANATKKGANDTPYDGKNIGSFTGDAIRNILGQTVGLHVQSDGLSEGWNGALGVYNYLPTGADSGGGNPGSKIFFDASKASEVMTAFENRPASISSLVCISY